MVIDLRSMGSPAKYIVAGIVVVLVLLLALLVTRFLRAIVPSQQSRNIDRSALRVQRRLTHGRFVLGRYRTNLVETIILINVYLVWAIAVGISITLISAVLN